MITSAAGSCSWRRLGATARRLHLGHRHLQAEPGAMRGWRVQREQPGLAPAVHRRRGQRPCLPLTDAPHGGGEPERARQRSAHGLGDRDVLSVSHAVDLTGAVLGTACGRQRGGSTARSGQARLARGHSWQRPEGRADRAAHARRTGSTGCVGGREVRVCQASAGCRGVSPAGQPAAPTGTWVAELVPSPQTSPLVPHSNGLPA